MNKLQLLRKKLSELHLDAFIVGSEDAHQSEYVCLRDLRREFISGFTGSAGTAVITQDSALLWTDGRYFLQAEKELSSEWTLMKSGEKGVPDFVYWIASNLKEGETVGIDPWLFSAVAANRLISTLQIAKISVSSITENPVDSVWTLFDPPAFPSNPVEVVPIERAGVSHLEKIQQLRERLKAEGAVAIVVAMLDEVAWLLNIRGSDIDYNPVCISYVIVSLDRVCWFVDARKVSEEVKSALGEQMEFLDYSQVEKEVSAMATGGRVWIDSSRTNFRLYQVAGEARLDKYSPLALSKSLKTEAELRGFKAAHVRDGAALTAFLHWLEKTVKAAPHSLTEHQAAMKLEEFRREMDLHVGPSFGTIAGYGENGAIIHYSPSAQTSASIGVDSLFLLDSGAQYKDGTTDVTRTMHFGTPTSRMKKCYTAVLKGHIALASLVVPEGTLGSRFDCVARMPLWRLGLDYNHGTGHGVGVFLNVHEGPQGIGFRKRDNEEGFFAGMTISNEPGYYEAGQFGIRIENLCVTRLSPTPNRFGGKNFVELETVTMVPIKTDLIEIGELTPQEIVWINDYHDQVRRNLMPLMLRHFPEAVDFLLQETAALS